MKPRAIGIDLGVKKLLILSNGVEIDHHPSIQRLRYNLAKLRRQLERQEPNSKRWQETRRIIQKTEDQMLRCQQDHANKIANTLTRQYKVLCIESFVMGQQVIDNKDYYQAVLDSNWELLVRTIEKKARERNVAVVLVRPFYTSQDCSRCGHRQKLELHDRTYDCPNCGLSISRDVNAAINIKRKGLDKLTKKKEEREAMCDTPF